MHSFILKQRPLLWKESNKVCRRVSGKWRGECRADSKIATEMAFEKLLYIYKKREDGERVEATWIGIKTLLSPTFTLSTAQIALVHL